MSITVDLVNEGASHSLVFRMKASRRQDAFDPWGQSLQKAVAVDLFPDGSTESADLIRSNPSACRALADGSRQLLKKGVCLVEEFRCC
jgi:hypothetical protein